MSKPNSKVDFFFKKDGPWQAEYQELRTIALDCGLTEELRWGKPCYALDKNNVVLIHGFKEYCALLFMKGALLKDPKHLLIQQTENVQAARQIRLRSLQQIVKLRSVLKAYIKQAIAVEKSGAQVTYKKTSQFKMPAEFKKQLNANPSLKKAFKSLTPGRQRGYLLYFSAPKRSETRESRVQKFIPQILNGKGLDD